MFCSTIGGVKDTAAIGLEHAAVSLNIGREGLDLSPALDSLDIASVNSAVSGNLNACVLCGIVLSVALLSLVGVDGPRHRKVF